MANLYGSQDSVALPTASETADQFSRGLWDIIKPVFKYLWPLLVIIIGSMIVAAFLKSKKEDKGDEKGKGGEEKK